MLAPLSNGFLTKYIISSCIPKLDGLCISGSGHGDWRGMGGDEHRSAIRAYACRERRGLILRSCFAHTRAYNLLSYGSYAQIVRGKVRSIFVYSMQVNICVCMQTSSKVMI